MIRGKKGGLDDALVITIFLGVLAIFAYPLITALTAINTDIQADTSINDQAKATNDDFVNRLPSILEGIYLVLLIGGYGATFLLAFQIDSRPGFFIIAAMVFTTGILVVPLMANMFDDVTGGFSSVAPNFVIIPFIMNNFLKITVVMWSLVAFGLYAKRSVV